MSNFIEPLVEEETNLGLHTKLCAQRYQQITDRLESMDKRFDRVEATLIEIKNVITSDNKESYKRYLAWAGVIITTLTGTVGYLLSHFVFK